MWGTSPAATGAGSSETNVLAATRIGVDAGDVEQHRRPRSGLLTTTSPPVSNAVAPRIVELALFSRPERVTAERCLARVEDAAGTRRLESRPGIGYELDENQPKMSITTSAVGRRPPAPDRTDSSPSQPGRSTAVLAHDLAQA